jgi:hypothetical protein
LESEVTRQGLLSYALATEGLQAGRADFLPRNGQITLGEWLRYGAERVPKLYDDIRTGKLDSTARGVRLNGTTPGGPAWLQQPALFDFARRTQHVVIGRPHQGGNR